MNFELKIEIGRGQQAFIVNPTTARDGVWKWRGVSGDFDLTSTAAPRVSWKKCGIHSGMNCHDAEWKLDHEVLAGIEISWYLTLMKTTISSKGQIVLPSELRREDCIKTGEKFEIERLGPGEYRLTRVVRPRNEGFMEALLSCPVKGWFQPLPRTETIADLKPLAIERD